jgi:Major Facilitator Superfamily
MMSATTSQPPTAAASPSVVLTLLPIMAVVLIAFLVIGLALPVLPLHVHQGLGLGTFVVGLVAGSQFAAALLSRLWAGHYADRRGAKRAVVVGLLIAAASGLLYLLSLCFVDAPVTSVAILLADRALLGGAESFIITGALAWGLALAGPQNTGKVIAWVGTAMYAAFALGAPTGTALYASYGFAAIALATTMAPCGFSGRRHPPPEDAVGPIPSTLEKSGDGERLSFQCSTAQQGRVESETPRRGGGRVPRRPDHPIFGPNQRSKRHVEHRCSPAHPDARRRALGRAGPRAVRAGGPYGQAVASP